MIKVTIPFLSGLVVTMTLISVWSATINGRLERVLKVVNDWQNDGRFDERRWKDVQEGSYKTDWNSEHESKRGESFWGGLGPFYYPGQDRDNNICSGGPSPGNTSNNGAAGGDMMEKVSEAARKVFTREDTQNLTTKFSEFVKILVTDVLGAEELKCKECGSQISSKERFCKTCGHQNGEVPRTCSCGTVVEGVFCPSCGVKYEQQG